MNLNGANHKLSQLEDDTVGQLDQLLGAIPLQDIDALLGYRDLQAEQEALTKWADKLNSYPTWAHRQRNRQMISELKNNPNLSVNDLAELNRLEKLMSEGSQT